MNGQNKKDIEILKALYLGNHLNELERARASILLRNMNIELKNRI